MIATTIGENQYVPNILAATMTKNTVTCHQDEKYSWKAKALSISGFGVSGLEDIAGYYAIGQEGHIV